MKFIAAVTIAASLFAAAPVSAQRAYAVHRAKEAAVAWLDLVDSGQYGASWNQAAIPFQAATSKHDWEVTIGSIRGPLGPVMARRLKWANYEETFPIPPSGQYVVLEYETRFENRVSAVEVVTPVQEASGTWKVASYYFR